MTMTIERHEGWLLAKSQIHHGGNEKNGSTPILRSIYMHVDGGGEVPIPYINGNAIRGKLRRHLMKEFLTLVGIEPETLNTKLYHTFFTGGSLESVDEMDGCINLDMRKEIRNFLPPVALLGCAIGNQMIPGKLKVGHAFPVCSEYAQYLPDGLKSDSRAAMPVRSFTDESFRTRKDDLRCDRPDDEQAMQMKVDFECFIPGTMFYHWFSLEYPTEIERSCFGRYIELFQSSPFVGGMSGTGYGEVIFNYLPELPSSNEYLDFLAENREKIAEVIHKLEEKI